LASLCPTTENKTLKLSDHIHKNTLVVVGHVRQVIRE
jgi:hypothetical protein